MTIAEKKIIAFGWEKTAVAVGVSRASLYNYLHRPTRMQVDKLLKFNEIGIEYTDFITETEKES
ncbi:MAG: hypothetical protein OEV44_13825 [Spirochaetota bacterium]|nr:hypothetical protein [Spirochaetota bacterium]